MKRLFFIIFFIISILQYTTAQAFDPVKWTFSVEKQTATEADIKFVATIDPGWSMYATEMPESPSRPIPTSFTFEKNSNYELVGKIVEVTKPEIKYDENFGIEVGQFKNIAVFHQKIKILKPEEFTLKGQLEYMCCNENSCLPPNQVDISVKIIPEKEKKSAIPVTSAKPENKKNDIELIEEKEPIQTIKPDAMPQLHIEKDETIILDQDTSEQESSSLWGFFLMALSAGFLGILTPCVYPMIPMTVSFFMRDETKRSKTITKAVIFGISIILIYVSVGLVVTLTKSADITNQVIAHWLTNLIFAIIFIIFSLSFFGLFEITLPSSLTNKIDQKADKGGYISAFFMALALVVISFSCTGPFVGSILVSSAQGLAIKPIVGMFGFGLAFALPFTLLAFFPSLMKKLPKSGGWMNSVKVVFAFIMLAFAFYFLSFSDRNLEWNLISRDIFLCAWIVIFGLTGYYLLGKIRFAHDSEVHHVGVTRLFFAIACFVFTMYLFTGLLGAPLQAISGLLPAAKNDRMGISQQIISYQPENHLCGIPKYSDHANLSWPLGLQGYFDYDEAFNCAKEQNKPVLLIFKGHACAKCKEMEANIWPDAEALNLMNQRFVLLALYTDDTTTLPEDEHITSSFDGKVKKTMGQKNADLQITRYQINTIPYYVILDIKGETIAKMGYTKDVEEFRDFLKKGIL
ncbi:MAG: thioredoxin family protein [Bacteroidales bacterium]|jgi:thiol:disulfide interchange protein DsbD|nr:thioredoxin family protein [Bacteroidales bacterium]